MTESNPLLNDWEGPWHFPPFAAARPEHFEPAFEIAMREHREELAAIANNPQPATFENTLAAFDTSGRKFNRVEALFSNLCASHTSPELQAAQRHMAVPLAAHQSAIYMDAKLFARVQAVHEQRQHSKLDAESLRLLERVHLDF